MVMFSHKKVDDLRAREREREEKEPQILHLSVSFERNPKIFIHCKFIQLVQIFALSE